LQKLINNDELSRFVMYNLY